MRHIRTYLLLLLFQPWLGRKRFPALRAGFRLVTTRQGSLKPERETCMYLCNPGGLSFTRGGSPPQDPIPYRFIYHFWQKRYPSRIPLIDQWYPLVLSLERCNPFLNMNKSLNLEVFLTFYSHKMRLLALLHPFTEMADFPTLLYSSTSESPNLLFTWSLKKVPLSGGVFPYRSFIIGSALGCF